MSERINMFRTEYVLKGIILSLFLVTFSFAKNTGRIEGLVLNVQTGLGIPGVLVKITELDITSKTDSIGIYRFDSVPAGTYSISFLSTGYGRTVLLNVNIESGKKWTDQIFLERTAKEGENFYIGGIEVTAERELLPDKVATTTQISSGEIEHIQASSLGDVMELIPGQRFSNPGLENVKQLELRQISTVDEADRNASLGTQILMDEVPISNNANMQLDTRLNDGATYRITTNAGIDLRQIPAENISSIEVLRGIPPARYGDLTSGAVLVKTKSGYTPYRAKYKSNPRNKELNLSGGFTRNNHAMNFNVNYAKSLRDIRVDGDAYSRLAGQLNFESSFYDEKLTWTNRLYYTRSFDEQELRDGDINQTERYNRSYTSRYLSKLQYNWSKKKNLKALFSGSLNRQDSYYKSIISRDIGVIGTRMEPGTEEGYFVSSYTTRLNVNGREWNTFGQLEYENQNFMLKTLHQWQTGFTVRHEFNNGPGREFDPLYPPGLTDNEGDRPRSYDNVPGLTQIAFYGEDEITGHLFKDFSLQLGLRYDIFGLNGINLDGSGEVIQSDHGSYLNPRINFVYYLTGNTQFRLGYGKTAKAPPISMLYPNPVYFDIVDSMYYDPANEQNRLAVVITYIQDRTNEDLKAFTHSKYEVSLDQRIGFFGMSLTGFYERMHDGFELSGYNPIMFEKYSYPNWPDTDPAVARDTLILDYRTPINSVESITRGLELAVTSKKIPYINTTMRIDAAYHSTNSWWQDNYYDYSSTQRLDPNLGEKIIPFWKPISKQAEELIIHYRFDTVVKPLKLWFTLAVEQVAVEKDKYIGLEDSLAAGFVKSDGTIYMIPDEDMGNPEYESIRRTYADYYFITESKPNLWLVNLRVSKELWPGSELSFFVNNLFNSRLLYRRDRVPSGSLSYIRRNPEIFYGIEFSAVVDDFIDYIKRY